MTSFGLMVKVSGKRYTCSECDMGLVVGGTGDQYAGISTTSKQRDGGRVITNSPAVVRVVFVY